jgi:Protein of unknown function (DUF2442)
MDSPGATWLACTTRSIRIWPRFAAHGRATMDPLDDFGAANRRAQKLQASLPRAISAHYDPRTRRIIIRLNSRLEVAFSPRDAEGLEHARAAQLHPIEISPSGFGIHFPKLDADLYLPALLEGFLGSKKWMASRMGSAGGKSRSAAKTSAAKRNGRLGGRPKKKMPAVAAK